jgi:hypothetical protein
MEKSNSRYSLTNDFDCQIPDEQSAVDTVTKKINVIQKNKINLKSKEATI